MITSNIDAASEPVQAKPFDTGDRVMLNSQLIITMPNRGRTYRFAPEDEFIVVRRKDEKIFYVAFIKAPWLGVFELDDEGFSLSEED
jgi:hypothetical protein|nr:MAG TPA: hypothetical protein [Bacteriophage sp.]